MSKPNIHPDYKIAEVAEQLSASVPTIYKLIHDGTLSTYKLGRGTRVTRESVAALRLGGIQRNGTS
ncbi:helix-turn-helix domain-containing protein [Motiliproteus sp. SC1-56]|uniref:helix-turn-helix domain-containing protein n=1 Tax=Motiliproteus sp. SC1-56 TaxID=2799565 RepID=UPI001A8CC0F9|nr:helix-turn-helix domain-containing protein [Motiliproteus sp. SC1-56]